MVSVDLTKKNVLFIAQDTRMKTILRLRKHFFPYPKNLQKQIILFKNIRYYEPYPSPAGILKDHLPVREQ